MNRKAVEKTVDALFKKSKKTTGWQKVVTASK